jgi:hypothetical protein
MAKYAIALMENELTMTAIADGFDLHKDYRLVKLHCDEHSFVQNREVRCIGFGCPPVFVPPDEEDLRVKAAMSKTSWFINGHDVIPFMQFDSVKALLYVLRKVDGYTRTMSDDDLKRILSGGENEIPKELVEIVKGGSNEPKTCKQLQIPGNLVLWMHDAKNEGDPQKSRVVCCQPAVLANLPIRLSSQVIFDHMTPRYHSRIAELLGENKEKDA